MNNARYGWVSPKEQVAEISAPNEYTIIIIMITILITIAINYCYYYYYHYYYYYYGGINSITIIIIYIYTYIHVYTRCDKGNILEYTIASSNINDENHKTHMAQASDG